MLEKSRHWRNDVIHDSVPKTPQILHRNSAFSQGIQMKSTTIQFTDMLSRSINIEHDQECCLATTC